MQRWFCSDWHLGHQRIIELADRPFDSVEEMNAELIKRHNALVEPNDIVFVLGDVALGKIADSLPLVSKFNGYKILVPGNHDRIWPDNKQKELDRFYPEYEKVFPSIWPTISQNYLLDYTGEYPAMIPVTMSHCPPVGDSHGDDRYAHRRPADNGGIFVHGHVHTRDKITTSINGSLMVHVGVDAWDYAPVAEEEIVSLIREVGR